MPEEKFETNLLRVIAAELHTANMMRYSQQKYGKPLEELDQNQYGQAHLALLNVVGPFYRLLTPEYLSNQGSMEGQPFDIPPGDKIQ